MALEKFDRLEEGLERLLSNYEFIQAENRRLKDVLETKDTEIEALREKVLKLDKEKGIVKEKVDTLLGRVDALIQGT